jgi:hypothetical protein
MWMTENSKFNTRSGAPLVQDGSLWRERFQGYL